MCAIALARGSCAIALGSCTIGFGSCAIALGSCAVGLDSCTFSLGSVIAVCPLMWPGVGDFELHVVSLLIDFGLCTAGCAVGLGAGSCIVSCSVGLGPCTISLGSCTVGLRFGLCAVGLGLCAVGLGLCGPVGLCTSTVDCAVAFSLGHTVALDVGWAVTVAVGCTESCIFVTSACASTIAVPMLTGDCSSAFADGCASAAARSALAPTFADGCASATARSALAACVGAWNFFAAFRTACGGYRATAVADTAVAAATAFADAAAANTAVAAVPTPILFRWAHAGCMPGRGILTRRASLEARLGTQQLDVQLGNLWPRRLNAWLGTRWPRLLGNQWPWQMLSDRGLDTQLCARWLNDWLGARQLGARQLGARQLGARQLGT